MDLRFRNAIVLAVPEDGPAARAAVNELRQLGIATFPGHEIPEDFDMPPDLLVGIVEPTEDAEIGHLAAAFMRTAVATTGLLLCTDQELPPSAMAELVRLKREARGAGVRVEDFARSFQVPSAVSRFATDPPPEHVRKKGARGAAEGPAAPRTQQATTARASGPADAPLASSPGVGVDAIHELSVDPSHVSDVEAVDDKLGFEPYVRAVHDFLVNPKTRPPLRMSVEGEWGSGKSSFMRQLEATLRPRYVTVRFNPWRYDKDEVLWAAFANELLAALRASRPWRSRWWADVALWSSRFNLRGGWLALARVVSSVLVFAAAVVTAVYLFAVHGTAAFEVAWGAFTGAGFGNLVVDGAFKVGGLAAVAAAAVYGIRYARGLVGNPLAADLSKWSLAPDYASRSAFIDGFHEDLARMVEAYLRKDAARAKIFVFIDDLDRCDVPRGADLLQALHLMCESGTPLVFVVGMDREKVAAGIAVKHEKVVPHVARAAALRGEGEHSELSGLEYGFAYLEKFIQVPFHVPAPTEREIRGYIAHLEGREAPPEPTPGETPPASPAADAPPAPRAASTAAPSSPRPAATASKVPLTAAQTQARARIKFTLGGGSDGVRDLALAVAPALDNNPRRLKQFVNVLRLRAYIASETGLFDPGPRQLSLEALAKFLAIQLRWSLLLSDLERDPGLLERLEATALGRPTTGEPTSAATYWLARAPVMEMLRTAPGGRRKGSADPLVFDGATFAFDSVLRVAPASRRTPPRADVTSAGAVVFSHTPLGTRFLVVRHPYGYWSFPKRVVAPGVPEDHAVAAELRTVGLDPADLRPGPALERTLRYPLASGLSKEVRFRAFESPLPALGPNGRYRGRTWLTADEARTRLRFDDLRALFDEATDRVEGQVRARARPAEASGEAFETFGDAEGGPADEEPDVAESEVDVGRGAPVEGGRRPTGKAARRRPPSKK